MISTQTMRELYQRVVSTVIPATELDNDGRKVVYRFDQILSLPYFMAVEFKSLGDTDEAVVHWIGLYSKDDPRYWYYSLKLEGYGPRPRRKVSVGTFVGNEQQMEEEIILGMLKK